MRIGTPKAKAIDTSAARRTAWKAWPRLGSTCDLEVVVELSHSRVEFVQKEVWWDYCMLQSQRRFQNSGQTSRAFSVPNDGLD